MIGPLAGTGIHFSKGQGRYKHGSKEPGTGVKFDFENISSNSWGVKYFVASWVPLGTKFNMFSARFIVRSSESFERFIVESISSPFCYLLISSLTFSNPERSETNKLGSFTCSITSRATITSKEDGFDNSKSI